MKVLVVNNNSIDKSIHTCIYHLNFRKINKNKSVLRFGSCNLFIICGAHFLNQSNVFTNCLLTTLKSNKTKE